MESSICPIDMSNEFIEHDHQIFAENNFFSLVGFFFPNFFSKKCIAYLLDSLSLLNPSIPITPNIIFV